MSKQHVCMASDANWTGQNKSMAERFEYEPYGQVAVAEAADAGNGTDGHAWHCLHEGLAWHDAVSDTYHFRNRDYGPSLGRWVQQDPMGYVDGMSLYEYVRSGPANYTDAMGLAVATAGFELTWAPLPRPAREVGHNPFRSKRPTDYQYAQLFTIRARADLAGKAGIAAPRLAIHGLERYLGAAGGTDTVDITQLLRASATARKSLAKDVMDAFAGANAEARQFGDRIDVGFRLMNQWKNPPAVTAAESLDWFGYFRGYAVISEALVSVERTGPGACTLTMRYIYHVFKEYNFDAGETFGPGFPSGTDLKALHDAGLAQNYDIVGRVSAEFHWEMFRGGVEMFAHQDRIAREAENVGTWKNAI